MMMTGSRIARNAVSGGIAENSPDGALVHRRRPCLFEIAHKTVAEALYRGWSDHGDDDKAAEEHEPGLGFLAHRHVALFAGVA